MLLIVMSGSWVCLAMEPEAPPGLPSEPPEDGWLVAETVRLTSSFSGLKSNSTRPKGLKQRIDAGTRPVARLVTPIPSPTAAFATPPTLIPPDRLMLIDRLRSLRPRRSQEALVHELEALHGDPGRHRIERRTGPFRGVHVAQRPRDQRRGQRGVEQGDVGRAALGAAHAGDDAGDHVRHFADQAVAAVEAVYPTLHA